VRIVSASSRVEALGLTRPYTIAFRRIESVDNAIVRLETDSGLTGVGAASPEPKVTGETMEDCRAALAAGGLAWLEGRELSDNTDSADLDALCREAMRRLPRTPAACAAVDIALHDVVSRAKGVPLVEVLGRAHDSFPTSITIGIKPLRETLEEAEEYRSRGFRILKVKIGLDLEEDLERLARLREIVGPGMGIRADANQGYSVEQVLRFFRETEPLGLEFVEQPLPAREVEALRSLPEAVRERIAADESLLVEADARALAAEPHACGIFNIKLMKCGGIAEARRIAAVAEAAGIRLMWGCMDESRISIAAALHAALSCRATRYLDLDGSLDLARDVVSGGFLLADGVMRTLPAAGLGVEPAT
jgi:L-alanine-DL-glutamate epimerase-like enolase superfamily enzyme